MYLSEGSDMITRHAEIGQMYLREGSAMINRHAEIGCVSQGRICYE